MLVNAQGKAVQVPHMAPNDPRRESVLKGLREALLPLPPKCGDMFKLRTRAVLKGV